MSFMQTDNVHAPVVLLGTFNMSQRSIEQDLSDWLATHPSLSTVQQQTSSSLPGSPSSATTLTFPPLIPDMVAIGLQELAPYPDAFLHATYNIQQAIDQMANLVIKTLVKTCPGYQFSLLTQVAQVGMTLLVFTRDETMTPYIQSVANASVGTGPLGMGNKGAVATKVAVSLPYPSRPFEVCFINAHLSAHLNKIRRRNDDYLAICRRMIFVEEEEKEKEAVAGNRPPRMRNDEGADSGPSYTSLSTMSEGNGDDGDESDDVDDFDDHDQQPLLQQHHSSHGSAPRRGSLGATGPSRKRSQPPQASKRGRKKYGSSKKPSVEKTIFSCDYVFWMGDLNYRLDLEESDGSLKPSSSFTASFSSSPSSSSILRSKKSQDNLLLSQPTRPPLSASEFVHAIENGQYRSLYVHDQLSAQRKTMNVFRGFHEAPLAFAPTYKFCKGTSKYDIRKRIPAWTDRVLWYVHPRDARSVEEAKEDEVDAWDEHSAGLGQGRLPMASTVQRRTQSGVYNTSLDVVPVDSVEQSGGNGGPLSKSLVGHRSDTQSSAGSMSRGTFSSLAKRGNARTVMDQQLFQPPPSLATKDGDVATATLLALTNNRLQEGTNTQGGAGVGVGAGVGELSTGDNGSSSSSLLNNRSGRNSAAFQAGSVPWTGSSSSSSSLLQPQQVAQGVETSTSPLMIHYYTSHPVYLSSDHKPVSALFTLLPHNLATQLAASPYGVDRHWRWKKMIGQKLTTVAGHLLRWGFVVLGLVAVTGLLAFVRRHLHGW